MHHHFTRRSIPRPTPTLEVRLGPVILRMRYQRGALVVRWSIWGTGRGGALVAPLRTLALGAPRRNARPRPAKRRAEPLFKPRSRFAARRTPRSRRDAWLLQRRQIGR